MQQLARSVVLLDGRPSAAFNVYVADGVVIDAATRHDRRRILRQLGGLEVRAHAVTHAHADHQGSSSAICTALGVPFWGPEGEREALETGDLSATGPVGAITRWERKQLAGPGHPLDRGLREGDAVGDFMVLETPGHSPGHVSFWRQADGVLLLGDVLLNRHVVTGRVGLREPPRRFTLDLVANRRAIRRVAALHPKVVCFGHGPPLHNDGQIEEFADALGH
ncbi:MAG: MBL fold metallo-hydrolase [Solirubrobacteraceae bacterium]|nr:MBL fold metallo-hydrolase [Solirubrobacteraceae bacterium]